VVILTGKLGKLVSPIIVIRRPSSSVANAVSHGLLGSGGYVA